MRAATDIPVLLIVFNRPDKTRRMISALREVRPRQLFVAADGPRPAVPEDAARCAQTRQVLDEIDWPCELRRLFHDDNLGCKSAPETAISWFFSHVPDGIVLEDDCLPTADFFPFCGELLDRYRDDERVMMVGGYNRLGTWPGAGASYVFSRTSPTWGWATWRRAWQFYDPQMAQWPSDEAQQAVRARMPAAEFRMTRRRFDLVHGGELDAWDFAWAFSMLRRGGLSIIPTHNMITNIGFDEDATHTRNPWSADSRVPTAPVVFPLTHPASLEPAADHEAALFRRRFPMTRRIMTVLPPGLSNGIRTAVYGAVAGGRQ